MTTGTLDANLPRNDADTRWMRQALTLAEESIGLASPNPVVGCVLVRDDVIVGRGAHIYDNLDHAEIVALRDAGERAQGATAYVTLEPCSHTGRTGPCAEALVRSSVRRVVVATVDPNPLVSGRGIARLREAGVAVTVGVLAEGARQLNDGFARYIRQKLPFVTLKAGLSLDGRIAPAAAASERDPAGFSTPQRGRSVMQGRPGDQDPTTNESRTANEGRAIEGRNLPIYLTSTRSLVAVQRMRHASDALMTGIGTVLKDNPLLTDRSGLRRRRPLLRVVLDSSLRLPLDSRLVESAQVRDGQPDLLVLTRDGSTARAEAMRQAGVEVAEVGTEAPGLGSVSEGSQERTSGFDRLGSSEPGWPGLQPVMAMLGERYGVVNLLTEGGSHLNRTLLGEELVDKLCLFYAPLFLGDCGVPLIGGRGSLHPELQRTSLTSSGDDFCFEAYLRDAWR